MCYTASVCRTVLQSLYLQLLLLLLLWIHQSHLAALAGCTRPSQSSPTHCHLQHHTHTHTFNCGRLLCACLHCCSLLHLNVVQSAHKVL
jgi:hypothetical protein